MQNIKSRYWLLSIVTLVVTFFPHAAMAGWPSADQVIDKVAPLAGLNNDQIEFVKFSLKKPDCSSTIVSYTAAQDYSIAVFIGALKTAKLESVPKVPKMSYAQCKAYNPLERAYIFMDTVGDKLASSSGPMKGIIKDQINEGKTELNSQVQSIPYLGTILVNWDCECDAAYMTKLQSEKDVNEKIIQVIKIGQDVQSGNIPAALEMMVTALGPEAACDVAAKWTPVGSVPIVSDAASKACDSVAGTAVGWVVSGTGTIAEAVGIIGGEHMDPDDYYYHHSLFHEEMGKPDWRDWTDLAYDKCYGYFEPSNMAADTAKKLCNVLKQRFIDENEGKEQAAAWAKDTNFNADYLKQQALSAVQMGDAAFQSLVDGIDKACESYASQKYPKIKIYEKNYASDVNPYNAGYCEVANMMEKVREKAQQQLVNDVTNQNAPFCKAGESRNTVLCDGTGFKACVVTLPALCKKSTSQKGGMEIPCCQLGDGTSSTFVDSSKFANEVAKKHAPYCKTSSTDPLKISCSLQDAYQACLKSKTSYGGLPDCSTADTYAGGAVTSVCCSFDASSLESSDDVKKVKAFVTTENIKYKGSCQVGGMQTGYASDPLIASCAGGAPLNDCQKQWGGACKKLSSGFVAAPCCDTAVFAEFKGDNEREYSPHDRSQADLSLTENAIGQSKGQCHYGTTAKGAEDRFKVVCDAAYYLGVCKKIVGRPAMTACPSKLSSNGWVTSPCCEGPAAPREVNARDSAVKDGVDPLSTHQGDLTKGLSKLDAPLGGNGRNTETEKRHLGTTVKPAGQSLSSGTGGIGSHLTTGLTPSLSGADESRHLGAGRSLGGTERSGLPARGLGTSGSASETSRGVVGLGGLSTPAGRDGSSGDGAASRDGAGRHVPSDGTSAGPSSRSTSR